MDEKFERKEKEKEMNTLQLLLVVTSVYAFKSMKITYVIFSSTTTHYGAGAI